MITAQRNSDLARPRLLTAGEGSWALEIRGWRRIFIGPCVESQPLFYHVHINSLQRIVVLSLETVTIVLKLGY